MASGANPLLESMAAAERLGGYFAMPMRQPGEDGWTDAADLFLGYARRLEGLVTAYGERAWASSNRHVVNSAFLVAYLSRVVFPAVGQYVLYRRAPDISLPNLAFHWNRGGIDATGLDTPAFAALPDDPAAGHPDALVVADEAALYAQLKRWLFEETWTSWLHPYAGRPGPAGGFRKTPWPPLFRKSLIGCTQRRTTRRR